MVLAALLAHLNDCDSRWLLTEMPTFGYLQTVAD
jgi:hypothetical protein